LRTTLSAALISAYLRTLEHRFDMRVLVALKHPDW